MLMGYLTLEGSCMDMRKKIAILTAQTEENRQALFLKGFISRAFGHGLDVCVFSMFQKVQSSLAREKGDSSIYDLVNFDLYDAIVLIPDTIHAPGVMDGLIKRIRSDYKGSVISVDKEVEGFISINMHSSDHLERVVSHMIEVHGAKDIAFLSGKSSFGHTKQRLEAYKRAMTSHGLTVDPGRISHGDFWYLSGESVAEKLIKDPGGLPDALVCANDRMAIGAAGFFASHGVKIPDDIKIAGFDSFDEGKHSPMPLTSISIPVQEFGGYCADAVSAAIAGDELPEFDIEPELFIGSSCGCSCESLRASYPIRSQWDTEESMGRVGSVYNHMNEDMMLQNSFNGIINSIFLNVYQIRPFAGLDLCLNEKWTEERSVFTDRILNVISCGDGDPRSDTINFLRFIEKKDILPSLKETSPEPRAFFFYPLHFEANCFGYVSLAYKDPDFIPGSDERTWIRNVILGLENYRRKDAIIHHNKIIEEGLNKDPVTGLYNYSGFMSELPSVITKTSTFGNEVGVVAVDINGLSGINKSSGHAVGDLIINTLGNLISKVFDDLASLCFCMGNGEIVALRLFHDDPMSEIKERGKKIAEYVSDYNASAPDGQKIEIYMGFGHGTVTTETELEKLVNDTINTKNIKKNSGGKSGKRLTPEEQAEEDVVRDILDNNSLTYHFQPIVDARTGEIFSYEALMRSSVEPYPNPLTILKYAEHMGRLYDVEALTFNNVISVMLERKDIFDGTRKLFINSIPGQNLKGDDLERLVEAAGAVRDTLVVEITEQSELSDEELAMMKNDFNSLGIQTAVDDYGTGYSNIANLMRYSPDYLKIDRVLLSEIQNSKQKQYFVKQIVRFSHENNIVALAEGVETSDELRTVIELGVDLIQGYYTARPQKELIRSIAPDIREEILSINASLADDSTRFVYTAGREARIQLNQLASDETAVIDICENDAAFKDLEIVGVPGTGYNIGIHIHGGYSGHIKLDNTVLKRVVGYGAVIVIEDGADVTVSFHGDCSFYGSIYVSEDSRVLFEGDGNANVYVEYKEYYGIGSGKDQMCGNMTFDVSGSVNIYGTGMRGVGIGSWENCSVKFVNGKYSVDQLGQEAVGIGSVYGSADITMYDSKFDIVSKASNYVAVGSFTSDANVNINHIFFTGNMEGNHLAGIGTLEGDLSTVYITKSNLTCNVLGRRSVGIGVAGEGDAVFTVDNASVNLTVKGETSCGYGTWDQNGMIKVTSSRIACTVINEEEDFIGAVGDNVIISNCDVMFMHNDKKYLMPDLMQLLHKGPPPGKP